MRPVGRADAVRALVAGEVEVGAAGAVRRERPRGSGARRRSSARPRRRPPTAAAGGRRSARRAWPAGWRLGHARDGAAPGGDEDLRGPARQLAPTATRSPRSRRRRGRRGTRPSTSCGSRAGRRASTGSRRRPRARTRRARAARTRGSARARRSASLDRAGVHAGDRDGRAAAQLGGDAVLVRGGQVDEGERELVGRVVHDVAEQAQQLAAALGRVQQRGRRAPRARPGAARTRSRSRRRSCRRRRAAPRTARDARRRRRGPASPLAVTSSTARMLSQARPCLRSSQPEPPPSARPGDAGARDAAADGGEAVRLGGARRARPRSGRAPARTTRRSGSTVISRRPRTSMTMPSSTSDRPATEWPPRAHGDAEVAEARVVERGGDVVGARAARRRGGAGARCGR